jgi:hypothetical protein
MPATDSHFAAKVPWLSIEPDRQQPADIVEKLGAAELPVGPDRTGKLVFFSGPA